MTGPRTRTWTAKRSRWEISNGEQTSKRPCAPPHGPGQRHRPATARAPCHKPAHPPGREARPNAVTKCESVYLILFTCRFIYPVHVSTRKSFGLMTRKLSVTESRKLLQFLGTLSRKKSSVTSANCPHVAGGE